MNFAFLLIACPDQSELVTSGPMGVRFFLEIERTGTTNFHPQFSSRIAFVSKLTELLN